MSLGRVILTAIGLAVFAMTCISIGVGLSMWYDVKHGDDVPPYL